MNILELGKKIDVLSFFFASECTKIVDYLNLVLDHGPLPGSRGPPVGNHRVRRISTESVRQ